MRAQALIKSVAFLALVILGACVEGSQALIPLGGSGTPASGGATLQFNYPSGFSGTSGVIQTTASAALNGSVLALTPSTASHAAGGAWYIAQQNVQSFTTTFTFATTPTTGTPPSGYFALAFVIQNSNGTTNEYYGPPYYEASADANMGGFGSYNPSIGANQQPIGNSVSIKFDASTSGQVNYPSGGNPSATGVYIDGGAYAVMLQQQDLNPYGINLGSADTFSCTLTYDGTILVMVLKDTTTSAQARFEWPINITAATGANSAWVGFTAGTPPSSEFQNGIETWAYWTGYNSRLASPTFSPAAGQYGSSQTVTISCPSGATCYYTTNGLYPTSASTTYTAPITVSANEVVRAVAIESGSTDSYTATAAYQIATSHYINLGSGFSAGEGMILVGRSVRSGSTIHLTDTSAFTNGEAGGTWWSAPLPVSTFSTTFQIQFASASANGLCFILQNEATYSPLFNSSVGGSYVSGGPFTIADSGLSMGYGGTQPGTTGGGTNGGIISSVAICFDLYTASNSVGLYTDGAVPTGNQTSITGLNISSGHPINVTLSYSSGTLALSMTDAVTMGTFSTSWTVNVPSVVGASTAYAGFTAGTGGQTSAMSVNTWTY